MPLHWAALPLLRRRSFPPGCILAISSSLPFPQVRQQRSDFLSCENGEAMDYDLENVNAVLQSGSTGRSAQSWQWSAAFCDVTAEITKQLMRNLNLTERHAVGFNRPVDHSLDRSLAETFFAFHRSAQPIPNGTFRSMIGTKPPLNSDAFDMIAQGRVEVAKCAETYRDPSTVGSYRVRKATAITATESVEGVVDSVVAHSALTEAKAKLQLQLDYIASLEQEVAAATTSSTASAGAPGGGPMAENSSGAAPAATSAAAAGGN